MEFDNIGMEFEGYDPDQDAMLARQIIAQHLPGCPDPFQFYGQCICFRYSYDVTSSPAQQMSQATSAPRQMFEQDTMMTHPTWAEVAGTQRIPQAYQSSVSAGYSASQAYNNFPTRDNSYSSSQVANVQIGQKRTYAQVAQDGRQPQRTRSAPNSSNQYLHPSSARRSVPDNAQSQSGSGPMRIRRTQSHQQSTSGMSSSWNDRRANRSIDQASYQQRYSTSLPQVQEGVPFLQIPTAQPRNVADFIQAAAFRGHRQPPPSSFTARDDVSSPISPGTLSVASSSASRLSNRRKGPEMKDPSLPHRCIECRNTFPKLEDLKRHVQRSHAEIGDRPYKCDEGNCIWAFVNPKDLRRHKQTHDAERYRYACPHDGCEKSYTRADNLTRHINRDHALDSAYMSRTASEMSFERSYFDEAFEG